MRKKPKKIIKPGKIKIGALNCQGLIEKIDSPRVYRIIEQTDIFGVSETWLTKENKLTLPGYSFYPYNRTPTKGASRGGVGVFVRDEIKTCVKIRYDMSCENLIWCRVLSEYTGYGDDLYLGFVYFPPDYSTREKKSNEDHFKNLLEAVGKLKSDNVILMGDFNARTKNLDDTLSNEKHDELPVQDFFSSIESKRSNQDNFVNIYGKKLIEYCIATLSYIANGRTLGDLEGKYTCHEWNGSSTVDYAVIKEKMKQFVRRFEVGEPSTGSDHCPILLELLAKQDHEINKTKTMNRPPPIIWNEKNKLRFTTMMNSEETHKKILELNKKLEDIDDENNLNTIVDEINKIYDISEKRKPNMNKEKKKKKKKTKMV